jgi:hypothetical protein
MGSISEPAPRDGNAELNFPSVTGYHYRPDTYPPRSVWVCLDALLLRDPEMPRHANGAGLEMRGETAGTLTHWIPTVDATGSAGSPTPSDTPTAGHRYECATSWCLPTHFAPVASTEPLFRRLGSRRVRHSSGGDAEERGEWYAAPGFLAEAWAADHYQQEREDSRSLSSALHGGRNRTNM